MKASESVRHIIMPCSWTARSQVIPDIIRHHSRYVNFHRLQILINFCTLFVISYLYLFYSGGRTIVFTETKDYCSELSGLLEGARPLHGDIQQSVREVKYL